MGGNMYTFYVVHDRESGTWRVEVIEQGTGEKVYETEACESVGWCLARAQEWCKQQ